MRVRTHSVCVHVCSRLLENHYSLLALQDLVLEPGLCVHRLLVSAAEVHLIHGFSTGRGAIKENKRLLNLTLEVVLEGRFHVLLLAELEARVDGQVHPDRQVVLDPLVHVVLHVSADVLVLVGRDQDLMYFAIVPVQLFLICGGASGPEGLTTSCSLSPTPTHTAHG